MALLPAVPAVGRPSAPWLEEAHEAPSGARVLPLGRRHAGPAALTDAEASSAAWAGTGAGATAVGSRAEVHLVRRAGRRARRGWLQGIAGQSCRGDVGANFAVIVVGTVLRCVLGLVVGQERPRHLRGLAAAAASATAGRGRGLGGADHRGFSIVLLLLPRSRAVSPRGHRRLRAAPAVVAGRDESEARHRFGSQHGLVTIESQRRASRESRPANIG
mmetsp:Transcript_102031/g.329113  ORF Transcript_102031/g.329113 Transcript_102031/m.329113 type:complete len:217 (+) Transcript_102031:286-936(+)